MTPLTLYFFDASHACVCAQLMLDHKGLEYTPKRVPPVLHVFALKAKRFPGRTVPALLVGDERVQGTRAISRRLDALKPDPPLFPRDPQQRRRVEEAERRGEEIQAAVRRIFYASARRSPGTVGPLMGAPFGRRTASAIAAGERLVVAAASRAHGATDAAARGDLARLPAMLDEVDRWLADGVIGGEQLNAADFQVASVLRPLPKFADLAPHVEGRPAIEHAVRVAGEQPGDMPPVLPAEWLEPLRRSSAPARTSATRRA